MPFRFRSVFSLLAIAVLGACSLLNAPPPAATEPLSSPTGGAADPRAELIWDRWGVPHIFADDAAALFYAHGWAQAESHGDLLLRLYGQARGRAAEYWGDRFVESDMWVLTNGIPQRADQWLTEQAPHVRAYLDAFAAGINAYADQNPDAIGAPWKQVLPVSAADILAHQQRVLNYTFIASPAVVPQAQRAVDTPGSNAWAIAPARSASRKALLLANPHLPWGDLFTWYEAHLVLPDMNAYGATLVGFPTLAIAFNENLGWTHTVNTIDAADLYTLRLEGDGYVLDGTVRPFEVRQQTLKIRQADGSLIERRFPVLHSVHGPVIAQGPGRAVALAVAGLDRPHLAAQYWDMMRARDRGEFEIALSRLQLPMFTVMYADRAGSIMHVFNGTVPQRRVGDWSYWRGTVRGDTSLTLWAGTHEYPALPNIANPATGWLQNANDPPWTTTLPLALDPRLYAPYMAPQPYMGFRPQRSARMIVQDSSITFDELVAYKFDARVEAADHVIEDIALAARTVGDEDARAAADVLTAWDRTARAESRGGVLFAEFFRLMQRHPWQGGSPWEVQWTPTAPLATPDGLADPRTAAELLSRAAANVRAAYGSLDVPWGDVHRLIRDGVNLPATGGGGDIGLFRVLDFAPLPQDSTRFAATGGDSYIAAVEFGDTVRARTLITYGNASQAGSPHRTDQLPLYARSELRPVWFTRAAVEQNAVRRRAF